MKYVCQHRRFRDLGLVTLLALLGTLPQNRAKAQQYDLYAGLIKSKGYVVGSPLSQSGLHKFAGDTTWTHIGWNHPHVSAVAIVPSEPKTIWLAAANGAMRSLDGGKSWKIVTGWQVTELQDVAVNPLKTSEVFIAGAYGIWRSLDQGDTWTEVSAELPKKFVQRLLFDRSTPGRILAATDGGVYVTTNGTTWTRVSEDVPILDIEQGSSNPNDWIVGTRGDGALVSHDNGITWSALKGRSIAGKNLYGVAIDPANEKHLAAGGWQTGLLVSTDGGRRWKKVTRGLPTDSFYQVEFDPGHAGRIWVATIEAGVFYSDDDGRSWTNAGMFGTLVFDLEFVKTEAAK